MPTTPDSARLFDRCGIGSPMPAEFDLDQDARYISLGPLTHDFRSSQPSEFSLPPESRFRFLVKDQPFRKTAAAAGSAVLLAVEADFVRKSASTNPVRLKETIWLWRTAQDPVQHDVHAVVRLYRSGSPCPSIDLNISPTINLLGEIPADGFLPVGSISIRPSETVFIDYRKRADLVVRAELRGPDGTLLPVSHLRYRMDDDAKDRGWLTTGAEIVEALELIATEGRFRTGRFDIGVPYENVRRIARNGLAGALGGEAYLDTRIEVYVAHENGRDLLEVRELRVKIEGAPRDSIVLSGLCGMEPRRVALAPNVTAIQTFNFPAVRARLNSSQIMCEPVELFVAVQGDPISIAVKTELLGGGPSIENVDAPCLVAAAGNKFSIPAKSMLAQALKAKAPMSDLRLHVTVQAGSIAVAVGVCQFVSKFVFEKEPADWLICIDFGTSSTALWIGRGTQAVGHQVGLGSWLSRIDQYHSERGYGGAASEPGGAARSGAFLLPSHIGLSSDFNLRADFDPLSLGDLTLSYPGPEAAARRLEALGRTYDISAPFPSSVHMPEYHGAIITEPKRKMILRAGYVSLDADVVERFQPGRTRAVRRADLAKVIEDYFDEFGGYTTPSALIHDSTQPDAGIVAAEIAQARFDPSVRFGIVVTHPCGIDETRQRIYRSAGQRFLRAFCGADASRHDDIVLVAEAFAAARYGIEDYYNSNPAARGSSSSSDTFVTLDVGAGTYDVTAIVTNSENANGWKVASHFGLAIGGSELDAALVKRIIELLNYARIQRSITDVFDIQIEDDNTLPQHRHWIETEFQAAKANLSLQLLGPQFETYSWRGRSDGGPPLDILVGRPGGSPSGIPGNGPVVSINGSEITRDIPDREASLSYERTPNGPVVRLRIWRSVFAAAEPSDGLDTLMNVMGAELPSAALATASRGDRRPIVVVTGRAALWPLLHEKIAQTVAARGEKSARMSRQKPFRPEQMKRAVVLGAISLAREAPGRDLEASIENPIALISFKIDFNARWVSGAGLTPRSVTILTDGTHAGEHAASKTVVIDGPFVIARIMPGLDRAEGQEERLRLFQDLYRLTGIRPFIELTHELVHPLPGQRDGPVEWKVTWQRDLSGLRLIFDCGINPPIEFGPFGGGRIYAPE